FPCGLLAPRRSRGSRLASFRRWQTCGRSLRRDHGSRGNIRCFLPTKRSQMLLLGMVVLVRLLYCRRSVDRPLLCRGRPDWNPAWKRTDRLCCASRRRHRRRRPVAFLASVRMGRILARRREYFAGIRLDAATEAARGVFARDEEAPPARYL